MGILRGFVCLLFVALSACGGGGSGGGSGGGAGGGAPSGKYFSMSANKADFHVSRYTSYEPVRISLTVRSSSVAALGAAFPAGQSVPWLQVSIEGSAPNYTLVIFPFTSSVPGGTGAATVLVGATDSSGKILQSETLAVTVDVFDGIHFAATGNDVTAVLGAEDTRDYPLAISNNGRGYTLTSDVPWATVPAGTQTTNLIPVTLDLGSQGVGLHTARITARNPNDPADFHSTAIFVDINTPVITVSPATVYVGGQDGVQPLSGNVSVSIGTGARPQAWTAQLRGLPVPLSVPVSSGVASQTPANFTLNGDLQQIAPGSYSGTLRVEFTVKGLVLAREVPVVVNREAQRLFPRYDGVALSSFPGTSMLTRQVLIADSHGRTGVPWSASASAPWVQLSPASGVTGDTLTISANPAALAADQFHEATVTLSSTDARVERNETIRVGLWKGSSNPVSVDVPWSLNPITRLIRTNPVEPWVYLLTDDGVIHVYHVYTGAHITDIPTGIGDQGTFTVSGDGRRLYVAAFQQPRVLELDAATGELRHTLPSSGPMPGDHRRGVIAVTRMNGHPVLWPPYTGSDVRPIDLETWQPLTSYVGTSRYEIYLLSTYNTGQDPSDDGQWMYLPSYSSIDVSRRKFTMLHGASLEFIPGDEYSRGPSVTDMCVSPDGRIYHLGYNYDFLRVYAPNLADGIPASINIATTAFGVVCSWDGRLYVTLATGTGSGPDLQVLGYDGAQISLARINPATDSTWSVTLRLSGDARRMVWTSFNSASSGVVLRLANAP